MKIVFYCQHVLGMGHFFRSLEICRALVGNEVILVTGGPRFEVTLPGHIRELRLPELGMDPEFKQLLAAPGDDIETVKRLRQARLFGLFEVERPELFVVELYPFGRKAFRFEIDPVLKAIAEGGRACGVVCSVRDILVEKRMPAEHEARVVAELNRHFDAVLVHADPKLVALEETFGRLREIRVPVVYTGFVTPAPAPDGRPRIRSRLGLAETEKLIVASAGGGSVGLPVLEAAVQAFHRLGPGKAARLVVFTGPFMPEADVARLTAWAGGRVDIQRFTPDFLDYLAAADLSLSMAGYNTTMNLLSAGVPALVWPFAQNREQRLRSERLAGLGALRVLADRDLEPQRLAALMDQALAQTARPAVDIDLGGAANTARWIADRYAGRPAAHPEK
jgi:predicted glycosyltransferase